LNTPSHLIINSALYKKFGPKGIPRAAFLFGSVAPDIPLGLLTLGFYIHHRFILGQTPTSLMPKAFDDLFFNNPLWIGSHNFLHSPTALLIYLALLWSFRKRLGAAGRWLSGLVAGSMIHTVIDIFTHVADGPLLFWPINSQIRFQSGISYYDPAYFGRQFFIFELALNAILLCYLLFPIAQNWLLKQNTSK
jgi:membrane-bound metal-dependent hydrolase YbcI (DUF457 family)